MNTQIILAVIALGASIMALYSAHTAKEIFDDLEVRIYELDRKFGNLTENVNATSGHLFDMMESRIGRRIDRQEKRTKELERKYDHLYLVVMEKIQCDGEEREQMEM